MDALHDRPAAAAVARGGRAVTTATGGGGTTASRFQIASVSKVFAAALTMLLAEDGVLSPADPVDRWLPGARTGMTIHHLLSHTSGVGHWDDMTGTGDIWSTVDDLLAVARVLTGGALIGPESLREMRTPHATLPEPERTPDGRLVISGYGYGLYVATLDGDPAWLHTGDVPGYRSLIGWFPGDVTMACLAADETVPWPEMVPTLLG